MLELRDIRKSYTTGNFTQQALAGVSLAFRDCEFVSILGPSGSGKTTLLNVIGGLDQFDSGDLIIEGVSTKTYTDRDWDTYRNIRIGFVFQSYNLIPHQTILANVELALTLSGVSPAERRDRAIKALADVGLAQHIDKKPSQLSGGQMQRVALARALINEPEIILADEPTGALDSATSIQVMDLLRDVAEERLVIMVTHNPELAVQYSTRIVELADGKLRSDTNPYELKGTYVREPKPMRHTKMGFFTALSLSFNNLMTKKGRTLMTAFAGSIGIIGIAAILALANGVNVYIQEEEASTLAVYPLQISSSGFDLTSFLVDSVDDGEDEAKKARANQVSERRVVTNMFGSIGNNDLATLKEYFDDNGGSINTYVHSIQYKYDLTPQIFLMRENDDYQQVNPDQFFTSLGFGSSGFSGSSMSTNTFAEMPEDTSLYTDQFDVLAGTWPTEENELALVLSPSGAITDVMSYTMGLRDPDELMKMVEQLKNQETVETPTDTLSFSYKEIMDVDFRVIAAHEFYVYDATYNVWTSKLEDTDFVEGLLEDALKLKISCIVRRKEGVDSSTLSQGIYYLPSLTRRLMDEAADSEIVQKQLENPDVNVISGKTFDDEAESKGGDFDLSQMFSIDEEKIASAMTMDPSQMDFSNMDMGEADFSFMTDALMSSLDLESIMSSIDASSLNLPVIDFSSVDLPQIHPEDLMVDFTQMDLTGIDLTSALTPELRSIMEGGITFDTNRLFDGVDVSSMIDTNAIAVPLAEVQSGLSLYLEASGVPVTDIATTRVVIDSYYAQPWVQERLKQAAVAATSVTDQIKNQISKNIDSQINQGFEGTTSSTSSSQTRELADRMRQAMEDQLAVNLTNILSTDLAATVADTLGVALQAVLSVSVSDMIGSAMESVSASFGEAMQTGMGLMMGEMMKSMADSFKIDEQAFADAFAFSMDQQQLSELLMALMSTERTSYDANLVKLGYADEDSPSEIDIYPTNFEDKSKVIEILDAYNEDKKAKGEEDSVITYTDFVGVLMTSVTRIVDMISYVLIAFVAISLVVSSIMIGVITYVSVLERKKEIGILRSIGASKGDVILVFIAETVIEGFISGFMGVAITYLGCIPANIIVEANFGVVRVARLPIAAAIILVCVSIFLSFIAGLMPARAAAREDPVEALRSE